ncbi:MAG: hypothetical protein K0R12_860 [Gammaproteobacteria bacterium]|jgi:hypothetical protein|nr:hypothetical protein [Gammaproteobacteria bacterium]
MKDVSLTPETEKENKKLKSKSLPEKSSVKKVLFSEKEKTDPELSKASPETKKLKMETVVSDQQKIIALKSEMSEISSIENISKEEIKSTAEAEPASELFPDFDAGLRSLKRGMFGRRLTTKLKESVQTTPPKGAAYINPATSPITKEVLLYEIKKRKLTLVDRGENGKFFSPGGSEYLLITSVGIANFFLKGVDTIKFVAPAKKPRSGGWQSKTSDTISFFSHNLQNSHENSEFKLKPFTTPKRLTKQGLSKVKKNAARSQSEFFDNISANEAASRCGLNPDVAYEYLHLYAHQYLGEESQRKNNLVLGTAIVNAQMIAVENAVMKIVNAGYNVTINAHAIIDSSKEVYKQFNYATKIRYEIGLESGDRKRTLVFYFFPDSDIPMTIDIAKLIMVCFNAAIAHPGEGLHCISPERKSIPSLLTAPSLAAFAKVLPAEPVITTPEVIAPDAIPPVTPSVETSPEYIVSSTP